MMRPRLLRVIATGLAIGAVVAPATTRASCEKSKTSLTARAGATELRCLARIARKGGDPASCPIGLAGRLADAFALLDAHRSCAAPGNGTSVQDRLQALISELVSRLQPEPGVDACAGAKLGASAARLAGALRCGQESACVQRISKRFERAFRRVERKRSCLTKEDAPSIAAVIDAGASDLAALIATGMLPSRAPSDLQAAVVTVDVQLVWTNPDPATGNTEVRLVRRLNVPPTDAFDAEATLVYGGSGTDATDPIVALLPDVPEQPRTYHYAVFGCQPAGPCETEGSRATLTPTLAQTLRGGSYVLYFRHATAMVCSDNTSLGYASMTTSPDWWKSCESVCTAATARQLTLPTASTESTSVKDFFDARAIPVGRVLSSEFCRCFTTAQLMDFGPAVETSPLITFFVYDDVQDRCANSRALVATAPVPGGNTAIVTHVGFTCSPLDTLAPAEALIYKPDGAGGTSLVTRVTWDEWATLP
jgi:hypothetical protein